MSESTGSCTSAPNHHLDRRGAMIAMGAVASAGLVGSAVTPSAAASIGSALTSDELGYDAAAGAYVLPPLPYAHDALEPFIDEQTMRIHHDKHHAGYVRGLNKAVAKLAEIRAGSGDAGLIKHWSRELAFHGCGHVNHTMFWQGMAPAASSGTPAGGLAEAIERDFGGLKALASQFKAASKSVEGSGWGWLAYEPIAGKLVVLQNEKHQNQALTGAVPLLGVDVWEHAYYLKYQNRRGDYLDAFWQVVNWPVVGMRFARATG